MIQFEATIEKFGEHGDKTGWTYLLVPESIAKKLKPGIKKSFRVKGRLDNYEIDRVALIPLGNGDFIMPLNAEMRKGTGKRKGARIILCLEPDEREIEAPPELLEVLEDEPEALNFYQSLSQAHRNYFSNWINSAKTDDTRIKRIAHSVNALANGLHYGLMLRALKKDRPS